MNIWPEPGPRKGPLKDDCGYCHDTCCTHQTCLCQDTDDYTTKEERGIS